jgi:hypothetical protein
LQGEWILHDEESKAESRCGEIRPITDRPFAAEQEQDELAAYGVTVPDR